jgi:hypothetical protein
MRFIWNCIKEDKPPFKHSKNATVLMQITLGKRSYFLLTKSEQGLTKNSLYMPTIGVIIHLNL